MRLVLLAVVLAGCGRVGFDASGADASGGGDTQVVDPSLLFHFELEASGILVDSSTYARTASCNPCPTAVPGIRGDAAQFSGAECIVVPDAAELQAPAFTFAAWASAAVGQDATILGRAYQNPGMDRNTRELFLLPPGEWSVTVNSMWMTRSFPALEWHHLAGTYDGTTFRAYADGQELGAAPIAAALYTGEDETIGCDRNFGALGGYFAGLIDDVRLYDRALSPAQIAELAAR